MKNILSVLLCIFMLAAMFSACAAVTTDDPAAEEYSASEICVTFSGGCYAEDGYIYNIPAKTEPNALLEREPQLESVLSSNQYVATGDIIKDKNGFEYTAVIYGDVNCDGVVGSTDYVIIKRHFLKTYTLEGAAEKAGRIGETMKSSDYLLIKRSVLGTFDLNSLRQRRLKADNEGVKVAYIPLDHRPVNKDRMIYLAAAMGIELLIPEEDLYRTALDNMTPNSNGTTYGDREALVEWLKSVEDECDYYVISLDQLISGGLVSSRWLSNTDLTLEKEIADYVVKLAKTKKVVLFDTVMRLASTVNYGGYNGADYNDLREYAGMARLQFTGASLNVENIIANYRIGPDGNEISTTIDESKLTQYYASRARKLRIIDYVLSSASEDFAAIYVGVDDSKPQITVQTNEINYIESICGDNMTLFAGADELGLMGLAKVATMLYGQANCNVTYFGGGEELSADSFDTGTLRNCVEKHLLSVGATVTSSDDEALQILVLTRSSDPAYFSSVLVNKANELVAAGKPVCIVDASTSSGALQNVLLGSEGVSLSSLLGYSNWNTVANAFGIAMSNAICRYMYIYHGAGVTSSSNDAFLKVATFSYVKDISYRMKGISDLADTSYYGPATIVGKINSSKIMTDIGKFSSHKTVSISNFRLPWNRAFEATFDITVN